MTGGQAVHLDGVYDTQRKFFLVKSSVQGRRRQLKKREKSKKSGWFFRRGKRSCGKGKGPSRGETMITSGGKKRRGGNKSLILYERGLKGGIMLRSGQRRGSKISRWKRGLMSMGKESTKGGKKLDSREGGQIRRGMQQNSLAQKKKDRCGGPFIALRTISGKSRSRLAKMHPEESIK